MREPPPEDHVWAENRLKLVTFLFKLDFLASSWDYPVTVEYWLIMGLKVMILKT